MVSQLAIAEALVSELKSYRKDWAQTLKTMTEQRMAELQAYRAS